MTLKGNLATVPLAEVVQMLAGAQRTGLLRLHAAEIILVEFTRGKISSITAPSNRPPLDELLLAQSRLSDQQLAGVRRYQQEKNLGLPHALLESGLVERAVLEAALGAQIEAEIFELFLLKEGEFDFLAEARLDNSMALAQGVLRVNLEPNALLLEAARRLDEWSRITRQIPSNACAYRLTPAGRAQQRAASGEEELLLRLAAKERTFEAMVRKTYLGRFRAGELVVDLLQRGWLEPLPPSEYEKRCLAQLQAGRFDEAARLARRMLEWETDPQKKEHARARLQEAERKKEEAEALGLGLKTEILLLLPEKKKLPATALRRAWPALLIAAMVAAGILLAGPLSRLWSGRKSSAGPDSPPPSVVFATFETEIRGLIGERTYQLAQNRLAAYQPAAAEKERYEALKQELRDMLKIQASWYLRHLKELLDRRQTPPDKTLAQADQFFAQGLDVPPETRREFDQLRREYGKFLSQQEGDAWRQARRKADEAWPDRPEEACRLAREALAAKGDIPPADQRFYQEILEQTEEVRRRVLLHLEPARRWEKEKRGQEARLAYQSAAEAAEIGKTKLPHLAEARQARDKVAELQRRESKMQQAYEHLQRLIRDREYPAALKACEDFLADEYFVNSHLRLRIEAARQVIRQHGLQK